MTETQTVSLVTEHHPITMLVLMNHQSGFDEATLYMRSDKSIEEILKEQQPIQSFEPGTVTAYSNSHVQGSLVKSRLMVHQI